MSSEQDHVGDCAADAMDELEEEETAEDLAHKVLKYPDVLAVLQSQKNAELLASLPPSVKRRIKALKKLQLEATHLEAKFFAEVHAIECKYNSLYAPLFQKRYDTFSTVFFESVKTMLSLRDEWSWNF